ncbi:SGNH hydrolase [Thozetella sp. PMI_491]|nr:SGNH hydrolase [Thozetella sp. PMI_491]
MGYVFGTRSARSRAPSPPIRVMIAGDSISGGWEGTHTWRYRLWQWFQTNNVDVVFVGPYNGTKSPPADDEASVTLSLGPVIRRSDDDLQHPSGVYGGYALDVEPEFLHSGSAHFAVWSRQVAQDVDLISQHIRDYSPDYLLVELGFNDLIWGGLDPEQALQVMKKFVDNARAASPELRFALANVPQWTGIEGTDFFNRTNQYNDKLREVIPTWSSLSSPVQLVEFKESYSCGQTGCPASLDGLHPNFQGEFELASAFSKTLYDKFSVGRQPLILPAEFLKPPCIAPANPATHLGSDGIRFTWSSVYGAYGYEAQIRNQGAQWSTDSVNSTQGLHMDTPWITEGKSWEFRVRTYCDISTRSQWTDVVSASVV